MKSPCRIAPCVLIRRASCIAHGRFWILIGLVYVFEQQLLQTTMRNGHPCPLTTALRCGARNRNNREQRHIGYKATRTRHSKADTGPNRGVIRGTHGDAAATRGAQRGQRARWAVARKNSKYGSQIAAAWGGQVPSAQAQEAVVAGGRCKWPAGSWQSQRQGGRSRRRPQQEDFGLKPGAIGLLPSVLNYHSDSSGVSTTKAL